jgi:hypothetical protein
MVVPVVGDEGNAPASLSAFVVILATVSVVALAAALPISAIVGGPSLLLIGVRGRREARAAKVSSMASELAILVGALLLFVALAVLGVVGLLLSASGRTDMPNPGLAPSP